MTQFKQGYLSFKDEDNNHYYYKRCFNIGRHSFTCQLVVDFCSLVYPVYGTLGWNRWALCSLWVRHSKIIVLLKWRKVWSEEEEMIISLLPEALEETWQSFSGRNSGEIPDQCVHCIGWKASKQERHSSSPWTLTQDFHCCFIAQSFQNWICTSSKHFILMYNNEKVICLE